jgi:Phosphotransferase enzyme family
MIGSRWLDLSWRAAALRWVDEQLAKLGRVRMGQPEQPHVRPWATALRIPTDRGTVWLKASAEGTAYEHGLLQVLSDVAPGLVLAPLVSDPVRAWSLLPDGGTTLRVWLVDHENERFGCWAEVVREHAVLQRATATAVDRLLAAGTPDLRPAAVEDLVVSVLADPSIEPDLRRRGQREWSPRIVQAAATLAESRVPAAIQHDDLHDGNVVLNGARYRVFDWGDASVAHPFGVFLVLRRALARTAGVDEHGPELTRLQDTYLECFSDLAPRTDLEVDLRHAEYVAGLGRICNWDRAMQTATPEDLAHYANIDSGWLAECINRPPPCSQDNREQSLRARTHVSIP